MNNIALGRYMPLNSIMHKMDPRAKILAMLGMLTAIFIPTGFVGYGIMAVIIVSVVFMSKLKLNFLIRAMKPMMFMLIFLMIINILDRKSVV